MKKFWSITVLGLLIFNVTKINSRGVPRASTEEIDIEKIDPEKIAIDNENADTQKQKNREVVDLHYSHYLQTIMQALEKNPKLRDEILQYDIDQIKDGQMNLDISHLSNELREDLDSHKRKEVDRIRYLLRAQQDLEKGRMLNPKEIIRQAAEHLDTDSPHVFTEDDLKKLISSAAKDITDFDAERHERFKKYELHKKAMEEERLEKMTDEERDAEIARMREQKAKHNDHEPMNHPGSKKQFEEVWQEEDDMKDEEFDPKTFFALHDTNSDGVWDVYEVEALMTHELKKVYNEDNEEDDMIEMEEERANMREHIFKEVDKNQDSMISREEFITYSNNANFKQPDMNSYETVDQQIDRGHVYSKEELSEFKSLIHKLEEELKQNMNDFKSDTKELMDAKKGHQQEKKEFIKYLAEEKKSGNHQNWSDEDKAEHRNYLQDLNAREAELNKRQKELQEMSDTIRQGALDMMDMKKEYAGAVMSSDEMKDTVERIEAEKMAKMADMDAKMAAMNEEMALKQKELKEKYDSKLADAGQKLEEAKLKYGNLSAAQAAAVEAAKSQAQDKSNNPQDAKMQEILRKTEEWDKKLREFEHSQL